MENVTPVLPVDDREGSNNCRLISLTVDKLFEKGIAEKNCHPQLGFQNEILQDKFTDPLQ